MPCSYCQTQFSLTKWKSTCSACCNKFCSDCYSGKLCKTCRNVQGTGFNYDTLMNLKSKELKNYLAFRDINTTTFKEKCELVNALLALENNKMGNVRSKKTTTYGNGSSRYPHGNSYPTQNRRSNGNGTTLPPGFYPHTNSENILNNTAGNSSNFSNANRSNEMPQHHSQSQPSFMRPPNDVPPSYARTQNDFPSARDYVNPLREFLNAFENSNLGTSFTFTANSTSSNRYPHETRDAANTYSSPEQNVPPAESPMRDSDADPNLHSEEPGRPVPTGLGGKVVIDNLNSLEQINLLSNKELKQILVDNFVDYKGCLEKSELQAKVKALFLDKMKNEADMKATEEEKDTDKGNVTESLEDKSCKICWDATIDCVFLECGHMAACTSCGKRLNECPICRQYIVRCVHVFRT